MSFSYAGNSIRNLVLRIAGERYHTLALIALSWRETVGNLLAERSTPVKYEHHVLFVRVTNSTWMQELILIKTQIIQKLVSQLHIPIEDIIFLAGAKIRRF
jgi:predicted nucleic acid-binding Zn ribbon protein